MRYLLALMESADPRLITRQDSKSSTVFRLGGSRSDLLAHHVVAYLAQRLKEDPAYKRYLDQPKRVDSHIRIDRCGDGR